MEDRCVDIFCTCLFRHGHVVQTVESILTNPEVKSITISCSYNHTEEEFEYVKNGLLNANLITQVPIFLYRCKADEKRTNEKLKYIGQGNGEYIALIDNDLIYPKDYLQYLIKGIERYNGHVSLHGVILAPRPIKSYYRDRFVYRGLGLVQNDYQVDICSSCMTMFKREWYQDLDTWYDKCDSTSMDDLYVSYFAKQKGIKRYVLAHKEGWVKHKVQLPDEVYVFNEYTNKPNADSIQTNFCNNNF